MTPTTQDLSPNKTNEGRLDLRSRRLETCGFHPRSNNTQCGDSTTGFLNAQGPQARAQRTADGDWKTITRPHTQCQRAGDTGECSQGTRMRMPVGGGYHPPPARGVISDPSGTFRINRGVGDHRLPVVGNAGTSMWQRRDFDVATPGPAVASPRLNRTTQIHQRQTWLP